MIATGYRRMDTHTADAWKCLDRAALKHGIRNPESGIRIPDSVF